MAPQIIRLLLLVLVFGAVMLSIEGLVGFIRASRTSDRAINKRLKLIASGMDRAKVMSRLRRDDRRDANVPEPFASMWRVMGRVLHGAGQSVSPGFALLIMASAFLVILIGLVAFSFFGGLGLNPGKLLMIVAFSAAAAFGVPFMVLSRMADNRRKKVESQFPIALDVFVRGLRAGHPVASALDLLTKEMTDPIGSEFGVVTDEIAYGADMRDSLQAMADRWGLQDMQMFVVCLAVQSETGGNLAEILENLSGVIRERASMYMKVRALSSEGRMTALILTALPILAFVALFLLNPSFYLDVSGDPSFVPGFLSLVILYFIGFFSIRRMINLEV